MKHLLLLTLALIGCDPYDGRPLTADERIVVNEVVARWQAAGLDDVGARCEVEHYQARIVQPQTQDEMVYWSSYCGPGDATAELGCRNGRAYSALTHTGPLWDEVPLYVVWRGVSVESALQHEAVHWLQECTGRGYAGQAHYHADPEVWCPSGCPGVW